MTIDARKKKDTKFSKEPSTLIKYQAEKILRYFAGECIYITPKSFDPMYRAPAIRAR
jgi:hypothetical protein